MSEHNVAVVDSAVDAVAEEGVEPVAPVADETAAPAVAPEAPAVDAVQASAEAAAAAERAAQAAAELAERRAAQAAQAAELADAAVGEIGSSAGFVTRAGAYYDVKVARVAASDAAAAQADAAAKSAEAARAQAAAARAAAGESDSSDASDECAADSADLSDVLDDELTDEDAAAAAEADAGFVDEVAFARQVARLTETVARQPLHREINYKVLVFCQELRGLQEIEQYVAGLAPFKHAANNPYHFIEVLEQAGGLERFELDEQGEVVTADRKQGLTEDEIDDLVFSYAFMTTPAGMAVVEQHTPRARIIELLGLVPERKDAYVELLEFCSEEPRTYNEISQLFKGRDVLVRMVDGEPQTMQPSVFVDKLEAAGGVEWRDGWVLTDEGRAYLAELHEL